MKPLVKILLSLTLAPLLVSCAGESSNPLEKYPGLKSAPVSNAKVETQRTAPEVAFIELVGTNEENSGSFIEGVPGEALLKISLKSLNVKRFKVDLIDFTLADQPTIVETSQPGVFKIQWTPPLGTIQNGQGSRPLNATVQVSVLEATDAGLMNAQKKVITLWVSRTNSVPKIIGRTDLSKGVDENVDQSMSVDIEDPATQTYPGLPVVQITPYLYTNTEAYRADGSRFVVLDDKRKLNPEKISATKWRFYYVLQVQNLPLDKDRQGNDIPSASSVDICFHMRAVSVVGTMSGQQQVCAKARYAAQPPVATLDPEVKDVKAGVETMLSVKFSTGHAMSAITLSSPLKQIANLSGKKDIKCAQENPDAKNSVVCVVMWTPACVKTDTKTTLTLKADSALNGKTKSVTLSRELMILANPVACTPVAAQGAK